MTKLEIACIIIGFIGFFGCTSSENVPLSEHISVHWMIRICITKIVCVFMIFLPLYFRYWR